MTPPADLCTWAYAVGCDLLFPAIVHYISSHQSALITGGHTLILGLLVVVAVAAVAVGRPRYRSNQEARR